MTQQLHHSRDDDRATVHHFIRLVGRAPTDEELARFRVLGARAVVSRGVRRRMARLITRW